MRSPKVNWSWETVAFTHLWEGCHESELDAHDYHIRVFARACVSSDRPAPKRSLVNCYGLGQGARCGRWVGDARCHLKKKGYRGIKDGMGNVWGVGKGKQGGRGGCGPIEGPVSLGGIWAKKDYTKGGFKKDDRTVHSYRRAGLLSEAQ